MDYFIGDTHFGHQNILEFGRPGYKDIKHHNETLVSNWNSVVTNKNDRVYLMGDVAFSSQYQYLARLNGKLTIVLGNHDYHSKIKIIQDIRPDVRLCGAMAYNKEFILTHIPVHSSQLEHRFKYNIHGHLHSFKIDDPRYINVSCEQINSTPISFEEIRKNLLQSN